MSYYLRKKMMSKIAMAVPDEFGCGHYRAKFPVQHCFGDLFNQGCLLEAVGDLRVDETSYDSFVFHRCPTDTLVYHADLMRKKGKKIAWQIDDDLWDIPSWMPSEEVGNLWGLNKAVGLADEIWVSTDTLAQKINKPNVRVLPNLIDINAFPVPGAPKPDVIRILWCGGRSHQRDLELLVAPLEQLVMEMGCQIQVVFWGYIPTSMLEFSRIEGTMNAMVRPKAEYGESVCYLEGLPFRSFYDRLARMRPYLALLPLVECAFNDSKTNLKFLEMTMAGAACIASDMTPYRCIENGVDGMLVKNTPNDWYEAIKKLIDEPDLRDLMAKNAYKKVCEEYSWHSEKKNLWVDAFKSLIPS
jgi:glycosyltransferase involved in cell wall biosynthesis